VQESTITLKTHISPPIEWIQIWEISDVALESSAPMARLAIGLAPVEASSRQHQRSAARYLLEQLLAITAVGNPFGWQFGYRSNGAPYIEGNSDITPALQVSISHRADWVAVGIAREAGIGVDIEPAKPRRDTRQMAKFMGWELQGDGESDFYRRWTLWEAFTKCRGGQLLDPPCQEFEALCVAGGQEESRGSDRWHRFYTEVSRGIHCSAVVRTREPVRTACCQLNYDEVQPW
jgi:phosphopantetheinyl transferase